MERINTSSTISSVPDKKHPLVTHVSNVDMSPEEKDAGASSSRRSFGGKRGDHRTYIKAIAWSVLLSTVVIMESFDIVVTTGFFKLHSFQTTFGSQVEKLDEESGYEISSSYQSLIVNAVLVGEIVGLVLCGWVSEKIGYKWTLNSALVLLSIFLLLLFFATHVGLFVAGQFLCGIPLGVFQTLPVNYAQDILPDSLKPYLTTYINFCWALGGLIGSSILRATLHLPENWPWRIPLALQWLWPVPILVGVCLAPESPVWLVRRGHSEQAMRNLKRLGPGSVQALSKIQETDANEREITASASYRDCFRKANVRRTEATSVVWAIQMICGSTLMYFSTVFFEEAGLPSEKAYTLTPVMYAIGCAGTFVSWFFVARFGRKTLYLVGNQLMAVILFGIGIAGCFPRCLEAKWVAAVLLIIFTLVYDCTVGPVCYCLVGELPSQRLKQKTVPLARCVYLILSIAMNFLVPRMLGDSPGEWQWGAKCGFFFGGGCILAVLWICLRLPETKGKTVEQIDEIFEGLRRQ